MDLFGILTIASLVLALGLYSTPVVITGNTMWATSEQSWKTAYYVDESRTKTFLVYGVLFLCLSAIFFAGWVGPYPVEFVAAFVSFFLASYIWLQLIFVAVGILLDDSFKDLDVPPKDHALLFIMLSVLLALIFSCAVMWEFYIN